MPGDRSIGPADEPGLDPVGAGIPLPGSDVVVDGHAPRPDDIDAALAGDASGSIIRGAVARAGTFAASTAYIAIAFAVVVRIIGPDQFGQLSVAIAIATIAQTIGDVAVASSSQRMLLATPSERRIALQAQLLGVRCVVLPVVAVVAVALSVVAGYRGRELETIAVVCVAPIFVALSSGIVTPLVIELRSARASLGEFARQILIGTGLLVAAAAGASIVGYGAVYVVASALAVVVALVLVDARWRRIVLPRRDTVATVVRETAWLALAVTVNAMFLKILTVVASLRTSDAQVGLFAAATRVTEIVSALALLMAGVAYPLLSKAAVDRDWKRFANAAGRITEGILLLMGAAVITLVVGAGTLISIFAGHKFAQAAPVLQYQSIALISAANTQALTWALMALRAERKLVITNLVGLATLVIAGVILIGPYGARGAAYSAAIGEATLLACTLVALHRTRPDAVPHLGRALASILLTGACVAVGLALPIPEIPATLVALAAFAGGALALRLVPTELLEMLPGAAGRPRG